jgi:hypothetical protein
MKKDQIYALFEKFEQACYVLEGVECWSAHEPELIPGYSKWENFEKVIFKTPVEHKILLDERLKRVEEGKITYKNWDLLKKKYLGKGV